MPGSQAPSAGNPPTKSVTLVAVVAAIGGFLFGYDTAVINGAVDAVQDQFDVSSGAIGFVVSSALLGCAVGAWFAGPIADRFGRIRVMVIAAALFVASAIGSAVAGSAAELTVWRVIGGLGVGAASVIAPAYIAEISPARERGRLGSLQQMAIVTGIFASLLVDYLIARIAGGAAEQFPWGGEAWRWMFASAAVPAVVYGLLALRIPESPRYLVKRGRHEDARVVLGQYVGGDVDTRVSEIRRSLGDRSEAVHLKDLRGPRLGLLPIVWVGILLSAFQQFVGINVIFYYSSTLWRSVGFSEDDSLMISVITSVVNIVATVIAISLIDKIGRRPLLLIGSSGMIVTLFTLAVCFATATGSGEDVQLGSVAGKLALVAANLYVLFFGATWGPVVWVLLGEMFPNFIRATALAVAAAVQWLANWAISTSFPTLADAGLSVAYGLYTLFAILSLVFVWRAVQETKGRELEDMKG